MRDLHRSQHAAGRGAIAAICALLAKRDLSGRPPARGPPPHPIDAMRALVEGGAALEKDR